MFQSASNIGVGTFNPFQKLTVLGILELGSTQSPQGGPFLYRNYLGSSNNYINVIGSEFSSGAMTLGYGATGKAGAAGYTSTLDAITIHRGVLNIGAGRLQFLQSRQAVNTPVGTDVPMTSSFSIEQNGLASFSDGVNVSGSLNVSSSITASNALITNTLTVQTIIAQVITSSTDFVTGSTRFGTLLTNTHQFTGSVSITGSLTVNGPLNATSSWAQNVLTASFVTASNVFGPFGSNSVLSSSFAVTSSFTISSSFATTSSFSTTSSFTISSSLAQTASFITASNVFGPFGSNSVLSASFASSSREIQGGENRYITMWSGSTRLTSSVFYQDASNNIGLGTLTPQARLHVYRDTDPSLIVGQSGSAAKQTILTHYTSGNGYFYIQSVFQGSAYTPIILNEQGGNVGIGTISPATKLEISGSSEILRLRVSSGSNFIAFNSGSTRLGYIGYGSDANNSLALINGQNQPTYIGANNAIVMTITGSNVGIGTITPGATLEVNGRIRIVTGSNEIYSLGDRVYFRAESIDNAAQIAGYGIFLPRAGQPYNLYLAGSANLGYSDTNATLDITSGSSGAAVFVRLNVNGNSFLNGGNVGIGTTTPTARLHVTSSTGTVFKLDGSGSLNTDAINVSSSGRVTIDDAYRFESGVLDIGSGYAVGRITWDTNTSTYYAGLFSQGTYNLRLGTTTYQTAIVVSGSNGNVGIGIATPSYKLTVATSEFPAVGIFRDVDVVSVGPAGQSIEIGARSGSNFISAASIIGGLDNPGLTGNLTFQTRTANALTTKMFISSSGNVGIGTISPAHRLDVSGSARITSSVFLPGLTIVPQTNVVTINTTTGQLYYTASSAIGGGLSGGTNNYIPLWTGTNTLSSSLLVQNVPLSIVTAYGSIHTYTEQVGGGVNLIRSQNRDTTAGITHESRFGTQQLGAGAARTLLYAASPNTADTAGELTIVTENGGQVISTIGKYTTGVNNTLSVYVSGSSNIEVVRLHTAGNSFLNGGNVGIGDTSPTVLVDAYKATNGIIRVRADNGGAFYVADSTKTTTIAAFGDSAGIIGGTANATASVYAGAVPLAFYVNGAERARIATTGDITFGSSGLYYDSTNKRLGIGVASPSQVLDAAAAFAIAKFTSTTGTNSAFFQYINTGGNFYLGLEGSTGATFGASAYAGVVYHSGAYPIQFFTSATLRATLTSGGNLGIGANTSTTTYKLDVNASGATGARVFSGSLAVGNILPSATVGRIDASNDVVAFSTSDMRFKTNIIPISGALDKITQIGGYEFDWVPNQEYHGFEGHDVGVIAQEIEKVLPEVVKERDSGYKAVKYEKIVPLLIEAIKEQQQQIDELRYLLQNKT
jgi:hypothetical protein